MNVLATLLVLALVAAQSPAKPNFSGEWKMNPAKSDFGALPPPTSITRTITHVEPALTIVEAQQSQMGDQKTTRKYVTDGTDTTFDTNGATVKSKASWKEKTLVVVSSVEAMGINFNDQMSLSDDGKTLTSVVQVASPQGELTLTVVFDRQ